MSIKLTDRHGTKAEYKVMKLSHRAWRDKTGPIELTGKDAEKVIEMMWDGKLSFEAKRNYWNHTVELQLIGMPDDGYMYYLEREMTDIEKAEENFFRNMTLEEIDV